MDFKNKRVTVMGLGLYDKGSGIEAVKFFLRQGAKVTVTDLRSSKELAESVEEVVRYYNKMPRHVIAIRQLAEKQSSAAVKRLPRALRVLAMTKKDTAVKRLTFILGKHREEDFKNSDVVFQNPSVPADSPYLRIAEKRRVPIVNDWSLFLSRHSPKLFIGVTGTRGKSTTTALIYEMLKKHYSPSRTTVRLSGNLGVSPLSFIDEYKGEPIVAELSSWLLHHFPAVKKSPNIAVVTNIMNDHMDKYGSMREYIADKENIFRFQKRGDMLVLNYDNDYTLNMAKRAPSRVVWFSIKKHLPHWLPLEKILLPGEHNRANALAAACAAEAAGVSRVHIMDVLRTFKGLPSRLQLTRTLQGVQYYNDTTATTPEATIAGLKTLHDVIASGAKQSHGMLQRLPRALRAIAMTKKGMARDDKRVVLICGGSDKKLEYRELVKYVQQYCKAVVLLPGTATNKLKLEMRNLKLEIIEVKNMSAAVKSVSRLTKSGDIVLLSPAAASFGVFKNEFDRGDQFVDAVKRL